MICENCGKQLVNTDTVVVTQDSGIHIFCKKCAAQFGHCPMCQHNTPCAFLEDPDPTPQFKMVARQMLQGNATFIEQRQVPNAERIKKFCANGNITQNSAFDE